MLKHRTRLLFNSTSSTNINIIIPHIVAISSHHIYNDEKKQYIVLEAINKNLSGVYLFGKPGRIICEGELDAVTMYSKIIRSWRWQRIAEVAEICPSTNNKTSVHKSVGEKIKKKKKTSRNNSKHIVPSTHQIDDESVEKITEHSRIFEEGKFVEVASEEELKSFLEERRVGEIAKVLARPFSAGRPLN
jgi:hypothetical protein